MTIATGRSGDIVPGGEPASGAWGEGVRIVVWLRGEQDATKAADLAANLAQAAPIGEGDLVVDLSEVELVDGAVVEVLVRCHEALKLRSRRLKLRAPSMSTQRVLDMCGLADLVEPAHTVLGGPARRRRSATD